MTDDPLDVVASQINARLGKADDMRLSAALLLMEAQGRVRDGEAGEITWERWCKANVQRGMRDIRRLLRIAKSSDPDAAFREERERAAEGMRRHRIKVGPSKSPQQRTNVSPFEPPPQGPNFKPADLSLFRVRGIVESWWWSANDEDRTVFLSWFEELVTRPVEATVDDPAGFTDDTSGGKRAPIVGCEIDEAA
jgi:hypothetical protein